MEHKSSLRFKILRMLRNVVDSISTFIFGLMCGERIPLPPITNSVLLLPATVLAERIRKKQLKSVDVLTAYIARIKDVQPIINAMAEDRFVAALEDARQVDELVESGMKSEEDLKKSTPLLGVPFTVKEHISVKGLRCTNGFVPFIDKVSSEDADAVKILREAGAIPIATTNIPELCMSLECTNKIYGRTHNPYDTRRSCGATSGGEGALIASAGSVFGIGSDYAGSIRMPSFMNGVFGHKNSSEVVSVRGVGRGVISEELFKFISVGPMCRYGEDLLLLMKVMSRDNPKLKLDNPVDLKRLKIYYADDTGEPFATPVTPAVQKALKMALCHFQDRYEIEPVQVELKGLENSMFHFLNAVRVGGCPRISEAMTEYTARKNIPLEFLKFCFGYSHHTFATLCQAFSSDLFMKDLEDHQKELGEFELLRSQFNHILEEDNSVFLYPTQPEPAPFHNESITKTFNAGYNALFNVLFYPVTHIPMLLSQGLPVGIQCVANVHNDRLTIAVAKELGRAFGGWKAPSPCHHLL